MNSGIHIAFSRPVERTENKSRPKSLMMVRLKFSIEDIILMFYQTIINPSWASFFHRPSSLLHWYSIPVKLHLIQYVQKMVSKTQITETTITACARYLIWRADNGDVVNLSRSEDTCSEFCPFPNDFMIIRNVTTAGAGSDRPKARFLWCRRSSLCVSYIPVSIDKSQECCRPTL